MSKVERGFLGWKETNTVYFDPDLIGEEDLVRALKEAKTYIGTVK